MKNTKKNLQDLIEKETNQVLFELLGAEEQAGDPVSAAFRYLMDAIETIKKADPETKKQAAVDARQQAQKTAGQMASAGVEGLKAVAPALGLGAEIFQALTKEELTQELITPLHPGPGGAVRNRHSWLGDTKKLNFIKLLHRNREEAKKYVMFVRQLGTRPMASNRDKAHWRQVQSWFPVQMNDKSTLNLEDLLKN